MDESMDEEIYQVVTDAIDACKNIDKNGCDLNPCKLNLLIAAILNRYIIGMTLLLESWRQS